MIIVWSPFFPDERISKAFFISKSVLFVYRFKLERTLRILEVDDVGLANGELVLVLERLLLVLAILLLADDQQMVE